MNTVIHSFSTRPLFINMWDVDSPKRMFAMVWYYALSLAYARRVGLRIGLHADTLGARLLQHLPYDYISTGLDSIPETIHPRMWAIGKAFALRDAEIGSVHIDGDVFLKKDKVVNEIFNSEWDAIAQYEEPEDSYRDLAEQFVPYYGFLAKSGLYPDRPGAVNTGIVGFRDKSLRNNFCNGWIDNAEYLSQHYRKAHNDQWLTPDLILEQKYAYQLCRDRNANLKLLLPKCGSPDIREKAIDLGYQHVITSGKYKVVDKCKAQLKLIDIKIYNETLKLCRNF